MSVNIKQADGLKRLSQTIEFYKSSSSISIPQLFTGSYNDLTDKPIVNGNATIESIETEQSSFYVQDGSGNTIALIDNQGVHSIDFYANGESVKQHMSSSTSQLNDLSGDLTLHKNNHDIHITSEEREKLNDPLSEEGDTLYINDAFGNTIAIFDANGLTTTNVTIKFNGESLEISSKLAEIDNNLTSIQNKNNDQDSRLDNLETATEKLDFIDASELDITLSIVDTHGNPIAQFDESGLTTTEVTIASAEGSPIQVGAKIEGLESRVSTAEGEIDTLQGQLQTLENNFSSHTDDTAIHITASERSTWNTVTAKANQSDLDTTNQNLVTETTNRQNADQMLQGNIDTEAQTRANEDTAINERTAEIEASENGVLSITDPSGNSVAQFDENGLLVTAIQTTGNVTIGGNITAAGNFDSKELSAGNITSRGDIEAQGEVKGTTITAIGNVSAADVKTSSINSLNSTIGAIQNNASVLEGRVSTAEGEIDTLQGQVSTLIASDSGKSVRKIVNEELAAALVPSDAQESLNTLQEIADWIQDHPEDAAAMNSQIEANTTAINNHINDTEPRIELLEEKTANIEDSAESDAFIIYDKNNQPGFQVDANGTTVYTLKADNATIVNNISVGSMSVGGVANVEDKLTDIDEEILELHGTITNNHYTKDEIDTKLEELSDSDISNGGTIGGDLLITGDLTIDGELQLSGSELAIIDANNNAIATFDKDGLTVNKINVQSDTDNFVKNFTFSSDGFYELDNRRRPIRTITIDVPAENSWECFYEYFRQDIFQMDENNIESCVGYFTRGIQSWSLPTKLNTYFSGIEEVDSFKIEMLGAVESVAECSMIVTAYTTSAISYSLQIYHSNGTYVTNGWRCDNIKTINGESLYGIGNIIINEASSNWVKVEGVQTFNAEPMYVKVESIEVGEYIQLTEEPSGEESWLPVYIHKCTEEEKLYYGDVNIDLVICAGYAEISSFIDRAILVEGETDIYSFTTGMASSIVMHKSYTPLTTNSAYLVQTKQEISPADIRKTTIIDLTSYSSGYVISNQNILSALNNDYRNVILRITSPELRRTSLAHAEYVEENICYFTYTAFSLDGGNQIEQGLATISLLSGEFNFFFEECFVYETVDSQTFEDRLGEISDILATLVEV